MDRQRRGTHGEVGPPPLPSGYRAGRDTPGHHGPAGGDDRHSAGYDSDSRSPSASPSARADALELSDGQLMGVLPRRPKLRALSSDEEARCR